MGSGEKRFDVFLSHNTRDKPLVERIALKLKSAGQEPWLDKWCLTPGGDWQDELADGLRASGCCAVFVGPNGIGDWEKQELGLALSRAAKEHDFRLFYVLLPNLPEPFDYSSLPPFPTLRTWVDLRPNLENPAAFQQLLNAIQGVASGPSTPIEPPDGECPYRGLQTFDESHSRFFYGRDADIQRLVEKLKGPRFLAVLGPSGSGKSSLVRAGLIPALRQDALPDSHLWTFDVLRPGAQPLTTLAARLLHLYPGETMQKTLDRMAADPRTLHLATSFAMTDCPEGQRLVWVIDQFEEIFTLCRDEQERAPFLANLLYAASIPNGRNALVLTLRADFYYKCAAYPDLAAHLAAQQYLVSPMDREGLRQAIQEPARQVGLELEAGLVDTILEDIGNEPGALPLLEHALSELWKRRLGGTLTLQGYRETGGVQGAIAQRAEAIYKEFEPEQQAVARRVLLRLTQPGEGTEDTRRRSRMSEFSDKPVVVESIVSTLTKERLLTTSADEQSGERQVDVSHEALIRGWPRLRRWVDEDREGLRVHRQLSEAAQEWLRLNHEEGVLYRGARLAEVIEWRAKNPDSPNQLELAFLEASESLRMREEEEQKEQQRRELETMRELAETAQARARAERRGRLIAVALFVMALILAVTQSIEPIRREVLRQRAMGAPMVEIPDSETTLGSNAPTRDKFIFLPERTYHIPRFAIEPYEVTNARYMLCVEAGTCSRPNAGPREYSGSERADYPVVNVTALQANDFCQWLGRRLPDDLEWERAARFTDGRRWPWGDSAPSSERANYFYDSELPIQPVGQFEKGKSQEGVYDLAGNVWEWTRSGYDWTAPSWPGPAGDIADGSLSVRGGGTDTSPSALNNTIAYRSGASPVFGDSDRGFRCAASR